jgi:hypothetical protein
MPARQPDRRARSRKIESYAGPIGDDSLRPHSRAVADAGRPVAGFLPACASQPRDRAGLGSGKVPVASRRIARASFV